MELEEGESWVRNPELISCSFSTLHFATHAHVLWFFGTGGRVFSLFWSSGFAWLRATVCSQDECISGLFTVLKVVLQRSPQLHSCVKGQRYVHSGAPSEINSRIAEDGSSWQPLSFPPPPFFFFWWGCLVFLLLKWGHCLKVSLLWAHSMQWCLKSYHAWQRLGLQQHY